LAGPFMITWSGRKPTSSAACTSIRLIASA
jgi:hypothetical protein